MKMVKSLILGSAAGLVAMSGAQAADLPVKAKAVEYVKICSLYGAGFYYIPGTDTCIKLGGFIRVDVVANSNGDDTQPFTTPGSFGNRYSNAYTWRSRFDLNVDTRTATEYGVVRTYAEFVGSWTSDSWNASGTNNLGSVYSQIGASGLGQANNGTAGAVANGTLGVYYAYIQFAGFTMGKAISPFSMPWSNYPGNNFDGLVGGGGTVTGVNQFVYTAQFGNGVSGTIGFQEPTQYYQAGILNLGAVAAGIGNLPSGVAGLPVGTGVNAQAGTSIPDIVANIGVAQAWGMAQFSAAAHQNHAAYYVTGGPFNIITGHPDDKWGFAVQGGFTLNTPSIGVGDTLNFSAVYTDGATRYNIQDLAAGAGAATVFSGSNTLGTLGRVTVAIAPDSVYQFGGQQQLIQTWGLRGGYNHNWNPYWSTSVYGAYAEVNYGSGAKNVFCGALAGEGAAFAGVTNCNPNYSVSQAGIITRWTPVKNLTFSGDFTWSHIGTNFAGVLAQSGSYGTGLYTLGNANTYQALFRAQRNW